MVETHLMQDCRVEIGNTDSIDSGFVPNFVGLAMGMSRFEASACQQEGKGVAIVIAPGTILRDR